MIIQRKSPFSGKVREMDLPITEDQLARWAAGELAQNVWPDLTPGQVEFIMTGISESEWDETFGQAEDGPEVELGKQSASPSDLPIGRTE